VGIADENRVVSPDERAVKCRADAGIGLCTDDEESSDSEARQHGFEVGILERIAVLLIDVRLGVDRSQFGDDLPRVAPYGTRLAGVLDPDDRYLVLARLLDTALDIRHHCIALVVPADHSILHIDDE